MFVTKQIKKEIDQSEENSFRRKKKLDAGLKVCFSNGQIHIRLRYPFVCFFHLVYEFFFFVFLVVLIVS